MITASRCGSAAISTADAGRSAGWMIGTTLALTGIGIALDKTFGDHMMIEALLHSTFFIALTVSSRGTFLRPYSRTARNVIVTLGCLGWYAFFLVFSTIAKMT